MTLRYVNTALDWRIVNGSDDYRLVDNDARTPPAFPTDPAPMEATVTSLSPTFFNLTHSFKRQVRSRGAHAWQIELRYGAMPRASFAPLWAFLVNQGGQLGTFTVSLEAFTPQGTTAGTPRVLGGGQTGSLLVTDGWAPGQTVLKKGDWIQVENDPKVYMVTADVVADGGGGGNVYLYPSLRKTPQDNLLIYTDPLFTCALTSDSLSADFDQCLITQGFTLNLVEIV